MTDAGWFRDRTQIVLPKEQLDGHRDALDEEFMVTVVDESDTVRIVGSPTVIPEVSDWLSSRGITVDGL